MDLYVTQSLGAGGTRRALQLRNISNNNDIDIFFDLLGIDAPPPLVLDGFVFGAIFYAMSLGQDIHVHGAMSFDALLNLNEFQEAWNLWKPGVYKKIKIFPEKTIERLPLKNDNKAIAAFSGGVDSIFTVLRHNTKQLGNASYPLNDSVLMVHGFDVPLDAPEQFEALKDRTKPLLDELNLKLLTLRTNLKELNLQDWEDSFMAQLACCLHNYSDSFSYGIVGSSEPYNALVLPWGSNPATDYLLSNSAMRLVHDGAGYSRTEKVKEIAAHETATKVLKVCWEGANTSRNCGHCEKCMRTRLNFRAIGIDEPECFDGALDINNITKMYIRNDVQLAELVSIQKRAQERFIKEKWVYLLGERIEACRHPSGKLQKFFKLLVRGEFSEIALKTRAVFIKNYRKAR